MLSNAMHACPCATGPQHQTLQPLHARTVFIKCKKVLGAFLKACDKHQSGELRKQPGMARHAHAGP